MAVDGCMAVTFGGGDWAWPQPAEVPARCTKYNSPLINGQCTNHRIARPRCSAVLMCPYRVNINQSVSVACE